MFVENKSSIIPFTASNPQIATRLTLLEILIKLRLLENINKLFKSPENVRERIDGVTRIMARQREDFHSDIFSRTGCSKATFINPRENVALHYLHPQNFASRSCLHGARRRPPFKLSPRPTRWLTERVIVINGPARRLRNLRTVTVQSSRITKHTASRRRGLFRDLIHVSEHFSLPLGWLTCSFFLERVACAIFQLKNTLYTLEDFKFLI